MDSHDGFGALSRRAFLRWSAAAGAAATVLGAPERLLAAVRRRAIYPALVPPVRSLAGAPRTYDLTIDHLVKHVEGRTGHDIAVNGSVPGPLLRFREGEDVVIRVTNRLRDEDTSVHWHGFLVPFGQDGVPGLSFPGIKPGETFTYRFHVHQSGTYWYHSHSGGQEQAGLYGPIIIDPATPEPATHRYDREYVVLLSDWSSESPETILAHLKKNSGWYNWRRRTVPQFFSELFHAKSASAREAIIQDRLMWAKMRMDATDISDVTGTTYTYLVNGRGPKENWTGIFRPGERVRLRLINGSAMTFFDFRIPGLKLTVIQADGQNVVPVTVDELRIGVAETYDVLVEPQAGMAYTLFAQALDRTGYARGTLAERPGMTAPIPPMDPRQLRSMGTTAMGGMVMTGTDVDTGASGKPAADMSGMDMSGTGAAAVRDTTRRAAPAARPAPDTTHAAMPGMANMPGMSNGAIPMSDTTKANAARAQQRLQEKAQGKPVSPGMPDLNKPGAMPGMQHGDIAVSATTQHEREAAESAAGPAGPGRRKLTYTDLRALTPNPDVRPFETEVLLRLTGDMSRYFWTINGKKLSDSEPMHFRLHERVRLRFVNETMMDHPMHLHGVFMEMQNGQAAAYAPRKHTVIVPPFETVVMDLTTVEPGAWAFHCHLLYHMMTGMFIVVLIAPAPARPVAAGPVRLLPGGVA